MEDIEKAIATLQNPAAGWATRKEIANRLGDLAHRAIHALRDHKDDADQDVRDVVRASLKRLPLVRANGDASAPKDFALEELAMHCAKTGSRAVTEYGEGYRVEVRIDDARAQDVFIRPYEKDDGTRMLRVFTVCGKPDSPTAAWALRTNTELIGCAFAVEIHDRFEHLILVENYHRAKVSPDDVLASVKQIAFYGDWLEKRISKEDTY